MDAALTSDELLLVQAARDFARGELLERDRAWDRGIGSVSDLLDSLAEMGFLSLLIPADYGGLECNYRTYSAILQELAWASPSTAVTVSVHNMVGSVVAGFADPAHREAWLTNWGSSAHLSAFALSESHAGSDAAACRTTAEVTPGGYLVNGEKMWISNGLSARWFLTLVRTSPGRDKSGLSCLLIDGSSPGLTRTPIHGKMGLRGSETAVVAFTDVQVPGVQRLGDTGDGLRVCLSGLAGGRIGIAAQAIGIAAACLDEMTGYAFEREQFGRRIGEFQAIENMLSDSLVELEAARALTRHAAHVSDSGRADVAASAKAKLYATEAANRIAYRAVQVFGGNGFINEYRVEQLYRDVRVTTIYEGTSEIQRMIIARELLRGAGCG